MTSYRLFRYRRQNAPTPQRGMLDSRDQAFRLPEASVASLTDILESTNPVDTLQQLSREPLPPLNLADIELLPPAEDQEVWAAGVTYLRSRAARMEESDFSANAYDRVYEAPRPELFFKSMPHKVVGPGARVGIRSDANWSVPEPELALVLSSSGQVVGYTIGNDMSSRDIEGENLLYLPQAKVYSNSCSLGPWIVIGPTESAAREWSIELEIQRGNETVFNDRTTVDRIKRPFTELADYLFRSQSFPHGAILLTGTGVVPPNDFSLAAGDLLRIAVSGIGALENTVAVV